MFPSPYSWKKNTYDPLPEGNVHAFSRPPAFEAISLLPVAYRVAKHNYNERQEGREPLFDLNSKLGMNSFKCIRCLLFGSFLI